MSRIMVVEDETVTAADLEERLTALGHQVTWFDNGADALAQAQVIEPDLVLMDIRLRGDLSGIDTAQRLLERREVPIVFLTAFADQETIDRACSTHPYGYLSKPFTGRSLATTIQVALTRAAAERARLDRERAIASALERVGEALIAVDESAAIRFINAPAEKLLRVRAEDVLGKDARQIVCFMATDMDSLHPLEAALRGDRLTSSAARKLLPPDRGPSLLVSYSAAPLHTHTRARAGAVLVFREVEAGETMSGSEPLVALDRLSRRLAHEINNPLSYNLGALQLALSELDQLRAASALGDPHAAERESQLARIASFLRDAEEGATRIASVVRELKLFSLAGGDSTPLLPLELLELAVGLSKIGATSHVRFVHEIAAAPIVKGSRWQLAGVLAFALRSAVDALERAGASATTLTLSVGTDARGWAELCVTATAEPASGTVTAQRDTDSSSIVHPTTVSRNLAEQVVASHGGELLIADRFGGRTIQLLLPPMSVATASASEASAGERRASVLVVDNERMIRRALEITLRPEYDVTAVPSARDALELLARGDAFDVVVLDLSQSELAGSEFSERLHIIRPELAERTIFLTDNATYAREAAFLERVEARCIQKPLSADRLVSLVAQRGRAKPIGAGPYES
jgi:CheY-like chemotaxis protein/nitrogen-specific signal transduction histidine kinase